MKLYNRIRIAYKKLKASVYFDKTQLVLRNRIVAYETGDIENKLRNISQAMLSPSQEDWDKWEQEVLNSVGILLFPKSLLATDETIIFNVNDEKIKIDKPQYFIDINIEGQILGILWVLVIGKKLDDEMYEHSYGNRLRKTLFNSKSKEITYSPYLYQPYFSQYESWRDQGLNYAKNCLDAKQDAIILTLDFKSFFYSIHMDENDFESFLDYPGVPEELWVKRVNKFVFHVIERYASLFSECYKKRNILPIGFFPSNILANWCLDNFDKQVINRWNPVYYGRYVDDIIIVDKISLALHEI